MIYITGIGNAIEKRISQELIEEGILPNLDGYHYLLAAIKFVVESSDKLLSMKIINKFVALEYDTIPSRVERSTRHAKSKSKLEHLTNSEIIALIAEKVRLE